MALKKWLKNVSQVSQSTSIQMSKYVHVSLQKDGDRQMTNS